MVIISELVLSAGCRVPLGMCGFGYVTADRWLFAQSGEREIDHQSSHYITDFEI